MKNTSQTYWLKNYTFIGTAEDKHAVVMDSPAEKGGDKCAPSPMDLILMAISACAGIDVKLILTKSKQKFTDIQVKATGERRDEIPRIFTAIHLDFVISGVELDEKQVARAIKLSADKYCSVSHMLSATVKITHDYELIAV